MPLDRATMVRSALDLLDEVGLDGLTVRRLAERLGVQNPALYWHFKNKRELLNEMAKDMLANAFGDIEPPATDELWPDWLAGIAERFRRALLTHRDGARVIASADLTASALQEVQEKALGVLIAAGLDLRTAAVGIVAVFDYTLGAAFEEQAERDATTKTGSDVGGPRFLVHDPARFPRLTAAVEDLTATVTADPDAVFKGGMRLLVGGMVAAQNAANA
jgi:AcrR family transcriptional regulator